MTHPRIAVLGTRGFPGVQGGVEQHAEQLYPRLQQRGFDITVYLRAPYFNPPPAAHQGVRLISLPCPRRKNLEAIIHSYRAARHILQHRADYDLAHIHAIGPALVLPLLKRAGLPVVVTHHGPDYARQKWGLVARTALRAGEQVACRQADAVIAVADYLRRSLAPRCRGRLVYIPNGILRVTTPPATETLVRWGLQPKDYVVAVGRWVPEKGLHDLLAAWRKCRTVKTLVLVGGADQADPYAVQLGRQIRDTDRVVATGVVSPAQLDVLYAHALAFLQGSYHEGLPLTLLEALGHGLPALVSDIPAHREILGESSPLFPPGDVAELAARLQALLQSPAPPRLDAALQHRLETVYNWDVIADQTAELYRSLL